MREARGGRDRDRVPSTARHARDRYFFVVVVEVVLPGVGLPLVPVSPVPDVPGEVVVVVVEVEPGVVADTLPEAFIEDEVALPGVVEAVLPGADASVEVVVEGADGGVLAVLGVVVVVVVDEVAPVPVCLSQPVTAAPARARTATTGMSFFMTSPIRL